jgi:CRISPR-associated protein Cas6/Cse3/CasE subtype I-E
MIYHTTLPKYIPNAQNADRYRIHQLGWSLLGSPDKKERDFLFYVNNSGEISKFHFVSKSPLITGISREIKEPSEGERLQWKILCNPVTRDGNKKIAIKDINIAKTWLAQKLNLFLDDIKLDARFLPIAQAKKQNPASHPIFIQQMEAKGSGTVKDPSRLIEVTANGIGPSKSFGYGLFLWNITK